MNPSKQRGFPAEQAALGQPQGNSSRFGHSGSVALPGKSQMSWHNSQCARGTSGWGWPALPRQPVPNRSKSLWCHQCWEPRGQICCLSCQYSHVCARLTGLSWKVDFSQAEKAAGLCAGLYNFQRMFHLLWEWIRMGREHRENETHPSCGLDVRGRRENYFGMALR